MYPAGMYPAGGRGLLSDSSKRAAGPIRWVPGVPSPQINGWVVNLTTPIWRRGQRAVIYSYRLLYGLPVWRLINAGTTLYFTSPSVVYFVALYCPYLVW
jgi:hypothetical protein